MIQKLIDFLWELCTSVGIKLLYAAIVLVIGLKLCKFIPKLIAKSKLFKKMEDTLKAFLLSFISIILYAIVIVSVAIILGVPTTSFLTILTSAGVAIGLALQGSLSNFAGGIMILLFKPFKDGDYIEAPTASGTVKSITIFYTTLTTPDNKQVVVPNGALSNATVVNYSVEPTRRNDIVFKVDYSSDADKVREILLKAALQHPVVLKDPAPAVMLSNHGDSSLDFTLRYWTDSADFWTANFDLRENVKKLFDENGIKIPYTQIDVHLDK